MRQKSGQENVDCGVGNQHNRGKFRSYLGVRHPSSGRLTPFRRPEFQAR